MQRGVGNEIKALWSVSAAKGGGAPHLFIREVAALRAQLRETDPLAPVPYTPNNSQLRNWIYRVHPDLKDPRPTYGDAIAYCEEHGITSVNMHDETTWNTPFVLASDIDVNGGDSGTFRVVITTLRLLRNGAPAIAGDKDWRQIYGSDTTRKISKDKLLALTFVAVDQNRCTQPIAIAIVRGETTDDYAFVAEAVKLYVNPLVILSDFAPQIANGFRRFFPGIEAAKCVPHMLRVYDTSYTAQCQNINSLATL